MANVKFQYGTYATFNNLPTKDNDTLYFLTDTLQLFKGNEEYTKSMKFVSSLPLSDNAQQGVLYIVGNDFSAYRFTGSVYQKVFKGYATAIPTSDATDDTVPTSKAVADYVNSKFEEVTGLNGVYVSDVVYSSGAFTIAKGDNTSNFTLTNVAHDITYDSSNQVLSIPMFGSDDAIEINFTKLSTISDGTFNTETENIELTLSNGNVVEIPVGSLVDVYTGIATSTTTTTISDDNKISVRVRLSATANNNIIIEEDGLYVPLPDAYTKAEIDTKLAAISTSLDNHKNDTDIHVTTTEKASWDAKVSSSELAAAKTEAIATAADDATSKANQALTDAKTYANGLNSAMNNRMVVVENSIAWQSIPTE